MLQRLLLLALLLIGGVNAQPQVSKSDPAELAKKMELSVGYFANTAINREIASLLCLNYELINPSYRCTSVDLSKEAPSELPDLLLLSEQRFNHDYKEGYELVLPLYHESFIALTRPDFEESIFSPDQKIGLIDSELQVEKIVTIFNSIGLKREQLEILRLPRRDLVEAFCNFDLDILFTVGIHPDSFVRSINTACDGQIRSVTEALPKDFFQRNRYLYKAQIPKAYYWRTEQDIETLSERYFLAMRQDYNTPLLGLTLDNFCADLEGGKPLLMTIKSILHNYENSQTPLNELGQLYIKKLLGEGSTDSDDLEGEPLLD